MRLYTSRFEVNNFPQERVLKFWRKKCKRRSLDNISNKFTNSSSGIGNIYVEVEDQTIRDTQIVANMEHNERLFVLDDKESYDLDDEMEW